MKKIIALFVNLMLMIASSSMLGQSYNNEWINYNQTYAKIKVAADGWYRIPYNTLINNSLPLEGSGFQLFHEGNPIPISVSTMETFSDQDYIEFYGKKNTGKLDAPLFRDPNQQLSSSNSLFTDTAIYFLTWAETGGLYFEEINNNLENVPNPTPSYPHVHEIAVEETFFQGTPTRIIGENFYFADFEGNEGFVSDVIKTGESRSFTLPIPALVENNFVRLSITLVGQFDDFLVSKDHKVAISFNGFDAGQIEFKSFERGDYSLDIPYILLGDVEELVVQVRNVGNTEQSVVSIANIQVDYAREFNFEGKSSFFFELDDHEASYIEVHNFDGEEEAIVYDLSNHQQIIPKLEGDVYRIHLPQVVDAVSQKRSLFLINSKKAAIFEVQNMTNITFINYANSDQQGDYIILTHPSLQTNNAAIDNYRQYRSSAAGGQFSTIVVDIHQLYDQFAFGIAQHPLAIRNFVNFAIDQWAITPKYLLIAGKGISYEQIYKNSIEFANSLVPTYGDFSSDHLLTARNASSYQPQLAVGRINARTASEVQVYLDKVIEYEQMQSGALCAEESSFWLKNALFLSQHPSLSAISTIQESFSNYSTQLSNAPYGANVLATLTQTDTLPQSFPQVADAINNGVGLIHYFGRSATNENQEEIYWNFDIQSPTSYDHPKRYPFILSQGSGTIRLFDSGDFTAMAEDFTLAPNGGAIAFFGLLDIAPTTIVDEYNTVLYQQFAQDHYGQPFGKVAQNTIATLYVPEPSNSNEQSIKSVCQQLMLAGDPALVIGGGNQADYAFETASSRIDFLINTENQMVINVNVHLLNNGKVINSDLPIHIYLTAPDSTTELIYESLIETVVNQTSFSQIFTIPINLLVGDYTVSIVLDELEQLAESCEINNTFTQTFTINCADIPAATIDLPNTLCQSDAPLFLTDSSTNVLLTSPTLEGHLMDNLLDPTNAPIGTHNIFYTNLDTGCDEVETGTIEIVAGIQVAVNDTIFPETQTELDFLLSPTVTGIPIAYLWSDGSSEAMIHIQAIGIYSVTVTNEQGCTATDSFIVNYENNILACPPPIDFNAIASSYCVNATSIPLPDPSTDGSFSSNTLTISNNQIVLESDQIGVHELRFSYDNTLSNCQYDTTVTIELLLPPILNLGEDQVLATGQSVNVDAGDNWSHYAWSTGDSTATLTISETGTYALTVTNALGCTATDVIRIGIGESIPNNFDCLALELQEILNDFTTSTNIICPDVSMISLSLNNRTPLGSFSSSTLMIDENQEIQIDETSVGLHEIHYIFEDADNLCAFDTTFTINILNSANYSVNLGTDTTILAGNAITLTADLMDENITYQWSTGATTPHIEVTETGNYGVTITYADNCAISDDITITVEEEMVGITNFEAPLTVLVYPNPTLNDWRITLDSSLPFQQEQVEVQVFDIYGRLVLEKKIQGHGEIQADFLASGTYLLQIKVDGEVMQNKKLIKL